MSSASVIAFPPVRLRPPGLRIAFALCALAAALVALPRIWSSSFAVRRRADFHLDRARASLSSGAFAQARREFRAALRLEPGDSSARRQLAEMELSQGNWEIAFVELASAAELHPESAEGWISLADLMVQRGWLEAPEAALDRALEVAPQRADAHAMRADLRLRLGRYHGARADAEAALASGDRDAQSIFARIARRTPPPAPPRRLRPERQIDVGSLDAWMRESWPGRLAEARQRLEAQLRKHDWAEAQRIVDSARLAHPESAFGPYLAGVLEVTREDPAAAERNLSEALAIAPRNPTIVAALARAWALKKNASFAGELLLRFAERDRSFALPRYLAARAYIEARDPMHAEAALRSGLQLQPESPVPYQHLADYDFGLDRAPEALEICRKGLERFPRDVALHLMLAQISASLGHTADAARAYEEVLSVRPDLDIVEYRLGMLLASQDGDADGQRRARQILRDLEGDSPSDPLLVDALGWLQYRAGDLRRAHELLESAVKNMPEEPEPHFHLASVLAREQHPELARGELQAALSSDRPFAQRLEAMRLLRQSQTAIPRIAPQP